VSSSSAVLTMRLLITWLTVDSVNAVAGRRSTLTASRWLPGERARLGADLEVPGWAGR